MSLFMCSLLAGRNINKNQCPEVITMNKTWVFSLLTAFLICSFSVPVFAETITCAECGMMSDLTSKFTAKITTGEKTLYFCDIGDLFTYLNKKKQLHFDALVKDYNTGEWINAQSAFYVRAEKKFKSPMGWGIASFKDKTDAASYGPVMNYDGTLKAVR